MRNGIAAAAGAALISVSVAGCGGGLVGSEERSPAEPSDSSSPAPSSETKESERTAPAKSLELEDKCSIVTEEQTSALGGDIPPKLHESAGRQGCYYQSGQAGEDGGWATFVSADKSETFAEFKKQRGALAEESEIAGYPAAQVDPNGRNCLMSLDVSDSGTLFLNVLSRDGGPDPCEHATKFAEAAVENLPDA